jgi:hypothetical protein
MIAHTNPFVARLMWRQGLARAFGLPLDYTESGARVRKRWQGPECSDAIRFWCRDLARQRGRDGNLRVVL